MRGLDKKWVLFSGGAQSIQGFGDTHKPLPPAPQQKVMMLENREHGLWKYKRKEVFIPLGEEMSFELSFHVRAGIEEN